MALRVIFDPFMLRKRQKKVQFSKIRFLFCFVLLFNIKHLWWCLKLSRAILTPTVQ